MHRLVTSCLGAVALTVATGLPAAAEPSGIAVTPITRDNQVVVSFDLADGYTTAIRDAVGSGLATTFTYDVELRAAASAWFDRTVAAVTIVATVRYDNLTRRYQLSRAVNGHVEDARSTEDQAAARAYATHFDRVALSSTATLEPNAEYYVRVRAHTRPRSNWFAWPWDRGAALGSARFTFVQ